MLSPKARNRVFEMLGVAAIVTLKLHDAWRPNASVAVQVTMVEPIGNGAPEGEEQNVGTGGCPPTGAGGV
jgi:hypothetical protein